MSPAGRAVGRSAGFQTFTIIWATQSLSTLGTAITYFAISIWLAQVVYPAPAERHRLAAALSAVGVAYVLPLLLAPLAGAWADRHDRRATMVFANLGSGLLDLCLAGLLAGGHLTLWVLVPVMLVYASLGTLQQQALNTCYTLLVAERHLPRANAMMKTMQGIAGVLAPATAAVLIALPGAAASAGGVALAVAADGITFFATGAALLAIALPSPRRRDRTGFWDDVAFGTTYIWRRRPLLWLLGAFAVSNFVAGFATVCLPLIVKSDLAADLQRLALTFPAAYAIVTSAGGAGGVAGGAAAIAWGGLRRRRILGVLFPMIAEGMAWAVFGTSRTLGLSAAALAIAFAVVPVMFAHSQSIWQAQVPAEMQGRVFSTRSLLARVTAPLSAAVAGWAGAAPNPGLWLAGLGLFYAAFAALQLLNPALRRLEDRQGLVGLTSAATP